MYQPLRSLVATALIASAASAQAPSAWGELTLPATVAPNAILGQGKFATYDAGATLHVFSSVTRTWIELSKSASTSVKLFNDCVLLIDDTQVRAVSAYFGISRRRQVTPAATLWNSSGAKNDSIALICDGSALHAFSAFTGEWVTRSVAAGASASVQRHVAVVLSGSQLLGMSAFEGVWHASVATAVTALNADGTAGFATGDSAHAFSAHTRAWTSTSLPANATFQRGDDWGLWLGPTAGVAYSGLRGQFVTIPRGGASVIASSDLYALLAVGSDLHAYSAVTGDLRNIGAAAAYVEAGLATALLHGAGGVRGYTCLRQQVAPLGVLPSTSGAGAAYAHCVDNAGTVYAFSAMTGAWHTAPTQSAGTPVVTTTTVAFTTNDDCYAFAAGSGQFVPLGHSVSGLAGNPSSAPLVAYDTSALYAFDTEQGRWLSTPRTGAGAPMFRIWRTTALAVDGSSAHGIGAQAAAWRRVDIGGATVTAHANSEVGYVVAPQRIFACGMLPEIVALQQYPHFRRVQPRGVEVSFTTAPISDALVFAAIAPPAAPASLLNLGELQLDIASAVIIPLTTDARSGVGQLRWKPPMSAAVTGSTLFAQLLVIPISGAQPYLSDRASVQLW